MSKPSWLSKKKDETAAPALLPNRDFTKPVNTSPAGEPRGEARINAAPLKFGQLQATAHPQRSNDRAVACLADAPESTDPDRYVARTIRWPIEFDQYLRDNAIGKLNGCVMALLLQAIEANKRDGVNLVAEFVETPEEAAARKARKVLRKQDRKTKVSAESPEGSSADSAASSDGTSSTTTD